MPQRLVSASGINHEAGLTAVFVAVEPQRMWSICLLDRRGKPAGAGGGTAVDLQRGLDLRFFGKGWEKQPVFSVKLLRVLAHCENRVGSNGLCVKRY